uniref:ELOVL fatty acid elongase 6 n=1 Tax=Ovis aries TaxID=9940 RepID=A0AC11CUF2_SHEEP
TELLWQTFSNHPTLSPCLTISKEKAQGNPQLGSCWQPPRKKSFLFSALYAAFVFGGRHLMNKRAKFELRKPLVLWSLTLAVFR